MLSKRSSHRIDGQARNFIRAGLLAPGYRAGAAADSRGAALELGANASLRITKSISPGTGQHGIEYPEGHDTTECTIR